MGSKLTTHYLGMDLSSPVIVGSCPLTMEPETVRQLVVAGAGAIVLPSMLQEQITYAVMKSEDPLGAIERSGYQPQQDKYNRGTEEYLKTIRKFKDTFPIPIIASINGASMGAWLDYAKEIQSSGADALELNWQTAVAGPTESSANVESRLCDCVSVLNTLVTIPIAVKLSQRFTNLASVVVQLRDAGAKGLVLFSHSPQWDVDIDRRRWTLRWGLSPTDSVGTILEGLVRARAGVVDMSIAASGGIRTGEDAIKTMIAGADVVMLTSEIYRQGPDAIRDVVAGLSQFLNSSRYDSLQAFQAAIATDGSRYPHDQHLMRMELLDPLTRSKLYYDPTPVATHGSGDSFGHRME